MSKWNLGTMGFSYKDWSGPFYPEYIPARDYLSYYSRFFNAVEIDSTFYGTPRKETVRRWADIVPEGFHICAKLPKEITHEAKLFGAADKLDQFLEVMRLLGEKLAVLLVQLPPSFSSVERPALSGFLEILPKDLRFAVEVRDLSWYTSETAELFSTHSVALAATEYENLPKRIEITAPFLYVRFIGQHGRFESHERERLDVDSQLEWWRQNLLDVENQVESIYGFFNNDYSGFAAGTCNRFKKLLGLPGEPFDPPRQPRLFD
jgi:uncharacterized protein YecE (DUF72 family)